MNPEPLENALALAGTSLEFLAGSLKGIPNFDVYLVDSISPGFSGLKIDERYHNFIVSTAQADTLGIAGGDIFSIQDATYFYEFTVLDLIPDMTGCSNLYVNFIGKTHV